MKAKAAGKLRSKASYGWDAVAGYKDRSRALRWSAPFPHHREQDDSGEEGKRQVVRSHSLQLDYIAALQTENCSESHDVISAIHVDHFASDAAAGVGREEDSGRSYLGNFHIAP